MFFHDVIVIALYLDLNCGDTFPLSQNVPSGLNLTGPLQYIFGLHDLKLGDVFGQN